MLSRYKNIFPTAGALFNISYSYINKKTNDYSIQFNWQLKNVDQIKPIEKVCSYKYQTN